MRLVVGMSGASGAAIGVRLLEILRTLEVEVHLVVSPWAEKTIALETGYSVDQVVGLAHTVHDIRDQSAPIASGSFPATGMIVAPCSMKRLAAMACGLADDLLGRAADVALKERRRLVLVAREAPLGTLHLENMLRLSQLGAVIFPPVPTFYNRPRNLDDVLDQIVARILDQFGLDTGRTARWGQPPQN